MNVDLNLLPIFHTVVECRNFSRAATRLGVSRSVVSQRIMRLEDTVGVPLFQRTTRSVHLTEEGERLWADTREALTELAGSLTRFSETAGQPRGLLRVAVTSIAERFLSGPLIASFVYKYPGIILDVTVTDDLFDIVSAGFDAGVRLGDVIERDMIAIALTGEQREVAVAAPAYLGEHGIPHHPVDLVGHRCIGWRPRFDTAPYRWEFERNGRAFNVAVEPEVTTNDLTLMIRTAVAGAGITFGPLETFQSYIDRNELVPILQDWLPPFSGFYIYYPSRRTVTPRLRALIDHVRTFDPAIA